MIIVWLILWLTHGTPALHEWNVWLVTLILSILAA